MSVGLLDLIGISGIILGALSSGILGMGFPLVAIPLMTVAYGIETAVVVTTLPALIIDILNLWSNRYHRRETSLMAFSAWGMVGAAFGVMVRRHLDPTFLTGALACMLGLYLGAHLLRRLDLRGAVQNPVVEATAGGISGISHSTIGVSGPIVGIFFLNRAPTRGAFIVSVALTFTLSGTIRAVGLALTGSFTRPRILAGLIITIVVLIPRALGAAYGASMRAERFQQALLGILIISLISLILKITS